MIDLIKHSYITKNGGRTVNEDSGSIVRKDERYCFTVCDGLGGHGKGEVASSAAAKTFSAIFKKTELEPSAFFNLAYNKAQEIVHALQNKDGCGFSMKTTVVSLVIADGKCTWSHLGDSRLYLFKDNEVKVRTLDHSVPQMLANSNEIKEKEIRFHPDRNRLLRVLGSDEDAPRFTVSDSVDLSDCQAFLLCTDGFWELIDEKQMCSLLKKSYSPRLWLRKMEEIIIKNGKNKEMDNYTAIAVFTE